MLKDKEYWLKKQADEKREKIIKNMSELGIKVYDKTKEFTEKFDSMVKELHVLMFEEEYDEILDSGVNSKDRSKGINPMSEEYIKRTDAKRKKLGFNPYDVKVNTMNITLNYCKEIISGK
ncbi:MAG: hypothetical protein COA66_09175 [Arcobacter sp.]|nr:MAG: hypothetical protein COA66_09175 [Arcobacter sp.]